MQAFAEDTGVTGRAPPRRYLWTDAFAVCNFLGLHTRSGERRWLDLALMLVDQVHRVLGRHREDDERTGWLSGLPEEDGARHPTAGGLRIGKALPERGPAEPLEPRLEWDRDGQYFHYLTKWMHALDRVSVVTGDPTFNGWARELALTAHERFNSGAGGGPRGLYWKMSIDLSRPLVDAMGQHDPLDGLITFAGLSAGPGQAEGPALDDAVADLETMCEGQSWVTDDPLGLGGLLTDAFRLARLTAGGVLPRPSLLAHLLDAALVGLARYRGRGDLGLPADHRLAFRELGLGIGLAAAERLPSVMRRNPGAFGSGDRVFSRLRVLERYDGLRGEIEACWLAPASREAETWRDHGDINAVMLATSLEPAGFLGLASGER
jgi:hypothetical protein